MTVFFKCFTVWLNLYLYETDKTMTEIRRTIRKHTGVMSHNKGKTFEEAFCKFMTTDLGYSKAYTGHNMPSRVNPRGIKLDIVAKRKSKAGELIYKITIGVILLIIPIGLVCYLVMPKTDENTFILLFTIGLILVLSGLALIIATNYTIEYAWVECKNWKDKVPIKEVEKMLFEFNSHNHSKDKRFVFRHKYFVSANGFVDNALTYAIDNKIMCYICNDNKFEFVDW
jgi:hypothetical protein